jgi:hypothetical protein
MRLDVAEMPPSGRPTHDSKPTAMTWGLDDTPVTEGFLTFLFVPRSSLRAWRNLRTLLRKMYLNA